MRLQLESGWDGRNYIITTSDPEMLGRWLVEHIAKVRPDMAAPTKIMVWPDLTPEGKPDWISNSCVIGASGIAFSPQEIVDYLQKQIDRARDLAVG